MVKTITTKERRMSESKVVEQRGLWLDEMEVGTVYRHAPGRLEPARLGLVLR